jgi:hypothetical protein
MLFDALIPEMEFFQNQKEFEANAIIYQYLNNWPVDTKK